MLKFLFKSEQEKLVRQVAATLKKRGHDDIKAQAPGFTEPQKVIRQATETGYIPDITSKKEGRFRLFAVETRESLAKADLVERWQLFAKFAAQNNAVFFIVFQAGMIESIRAKQKECDIEAQLWEISKKSD